MAGFAGIGWTDDRLRQRGICAIAARSGLAGSAGWLGSQGMQQFGGSSLAGLGTQRRFVGGPLISAVNPCRGVAKLVKALDFDSSMRGFESFLPCQIRQA